MKSIYNHLDNQKGIATIFVPVFLLLAIVLGIYLVQNRTNILPFASEVVGPETSFSLTTANKTVKIGEEFKVDVMVSSDFDAANTFSASLAYPADKLEVVKIEPKPNSSPSASLSTNLALADEGLMSKVYGFAGGFLPEAKAQTAAMPVISGKAYCSAGKPVVELNWAKVQTSDLEYLFIKTPDGKGGVTVSTLYDRYQYPIKDTGFISPVNLNTAYTYHLESFAGAKSNFVTITTPADCSATPTPTPTATPTPTPTPTSTPTPTPTPVPSNTPTPHPSQSAMPPAVCGRACETDSYCATAKDGCTSCISNPNSTQKVCAPAPSATPPTNYTYFIKKWIDQSDDKKGTLTLSGAVPNPGFKTEVGKKALMATVTFRAKADGEAKIDFKKEGTGIYRNSDNQNILTITKGTGVIIGSGGVSSGTPSPAYPGTLYLKPATSYVNRGCTLPVVVAFSTGGRNSDGVDALLQFNPKIMTVSSYSKGDSFVDHKISVNNDMGKLSISGLSSAEKAFNGAGILATVNFVINSSVAPGTKAGINFDFDPANLDKTTDSNIVETKVIRDILGSVTNGTYTIGEGSLCSSPTPAPSTKPTLEGSDGTWCTDSDGNGNIKNTGTCIDSSGLNKTDYCEGNTARDGYCSGSWDGKTWTKVHCEFGGYVCNTGTSCKEGTCIGASPSPSATPGQSVNGKRADLFKDSNKPDYVNDQDVSVFFSKCAEKGVELFGQPATVQPICDILEDGKITVSDWAVLIKFRNQSVAQ